MVLGADECPLKLDPSGIEAVSEDAPNGGDLPPAAALGLDAVSPLSLSQIH